MIDELRIMCDCITTQFETFDLFHLLCHFIFDWAAFIVVCLPFDTSYWYIYAYLILCSQEAPAIVKSYYDKRIVGCPGGEGGKFIHSSLFSGHKMMRWGIKWMVFSLIICLITRFWCYNYVFHRMTHLLTIDLLWSTAEDEHDVVWFWLEKGKSFECPVCTQYFEVS